MNEKINNYICEKCNFKTNIKARWEKHIDTELHKTGIRKKRSDCKDPLKCESCEYETKNKTTLLKHKLNNHSTKEERSEKFKYYCKFCDYGTFSIDSFDIHNNTDKHKIIIQLVNKN
jgi:hypothetical protein